MNVERINELKRFVEDFNAQLEEAYKRHEEVKTNYIIYKT